MYLGGRGGERERERKEGKNRRGGWVGGGMLKNSEFQVRGEGEATLKSAKLYRKQAGRKSH